MHIMFPPTALAANDINQVAVATSVVVGDARALLRAHWLFTGLDGSAVAGLCAGQEPLRFADGDWLFREGAAARHCLLVLHGQVEVLRMGQDGEERVYSLFGRGQLVAEASLFMAHGRYPMSARARGDGVIVRLPRQAVRNACANQPVLAMRMLDWFGERIYRRTNEIDWLTGSSAAQRLAAYLLSLMDGGTDATCVCIPMSRQQLAGRLGIRPETLSRLLSDWRRRGYLEGGRRELALSDPLFFRRLASGSQRPF